jgi:hypothetical protein
MSEGDEKPEVLVGELVPSENTSENTAPATQINPNLRPWKPGQSGNPGGRPRNPLKQDYLARFNTDEGKKFMNSLWTDALNGDNNARKLVLEYSIGKPEMAAEDREALHSGGDVEWLYALLSRRK